MALPTVSIPGRKPRSPAPLFQEASRTQCRCPRSLRLQMVHAAVCAIRTARTPQSRFVPHQSHVSGILSGSIKELRLEVRTSARLALLAASLEKVPAGTLGVREPLPTCGALCRENALKTSGALKSISGTSHLISAQRG